MKFNKLMINRSHQRSIMIRFLKTLIKLGFDQKMMNKTFPTYRNIDKFIYKFSKTLHTEENFH